MTKEIIGHHGRKIYGQINLFIWSTQCSRPSESVILSRVDNGEDRPHIH